METSNTSAMIARTETAMPNDLDEAERRCHEMIRFFRQEYERQCAPYFEILARIHTMRPLVIHMPDGTMEIPIALPQDGEGR